MNQRKDSVARLPLSLEELPKDWKIRRIESLGNKIKAGGTPSRSKKSFWNGDIPFAKIEDVTRSGGFLSQTMESITSEGLSKSSAWLVPEGSVLLTMYGTIGVPALTRIPLATNQAIVAIEPRVDVDAYFLLYALWKWGSEMVRLNVQSTQKNIGAGIVKSFPLPIPPLEEQRTIAHVLRTVQRAKEQTEQVAMSSRALLNSMKENYFSGTDQGVQEVSVEEICDVKGGKRLPKGHAFAGGPTPHPYIRVVDFANGGVDSSELRYLTPADHDALRRYTISSSDVYVSIAGTIGLVGRIPETLDGSHLTENAAKLVIRQGAEMSPTYLRLALSSRVPQADMQMKASKSAQPKLSLAKLRSVLVPVLTSSERQEAERSLLAIERKIDAEEQRANALGQLFKSLLHEFMTGKTRLNSIPDVA